MTTIEAAKQATIVGARRKSWMIIAVVSAGALLCAYWAWRADQTYRSTIMAIELEMANGRFGIAARELNKLLDQYPDDGEAAILLGRCEQERGRFQAASEALARVTPGSELSHKAILARMRLLHDQGKFAAAEQLVLESAQDPRNDRAHVRVLLVPIYSQLGRLEEAQGLLQDWWEQLNKSGEGASERAIDQLRMHIELAFKLNPVENVRDYLDQAASMAPDDDRVWLGRANLAIRTGRFDEASRWLDACLKRRPDDVPVWSSRLELGIADGRTELVMEALKHLPVAASTEARIHRIEAWLSSRRGDDQSERKELESLLKVSPADLRALDRLAQLAEKAGQPKGAEDFRTRRGVFEKLLGRYEKLFDRNQPIRDAEEMADLAEQLGYDFEARGFLTVEIATDPERDDLRRKLGQLSARSQRVAPPGGSLGDIVRAGAVDALSVDAKPGH